MALNIKSAETDRLARELAALTGESITEAVTRALEMRLEEESRRRDHAKRLLIRQKLREAQEAFVRAPILDDRSDEEIIGYDKFGTFR